VAGFSFLASDAITSNHSTRIGSQNLMKNMNSFEDGFGGD
jgi:hypothetical protein